MCELSLLLIFVRLDLMALGINLYLIFTVSFEQGLHSGERKKRIQRRGEEGRGVGGEGKGRRGGEGRGEEGGGEGNFCSTSSF